MTNTLKKYLVSNGYLVVSEGLKSGVLIMNQ